MENGKWNIPPNSDFSLVLPLLPSRAVSSDHHSRISPSGWARRAGRGRGSGVSAAQPRPDAARDADGAAEDAQEFRDEAGNADAELAAVVAAAGERGMRGGVGLR